MKNYVYTLEKYKNDTKEIILISECLEKIQHAFDQIIQEQGSEYRITRYHENGDGLAEIIKCQQYRTDGLYEWNGKAMVKLTSK